MIAITLALALVAGSSPYSTLAPLVGQPGVEVTVEVIPSFIRAAGLSENNISDIVKESLRAADVPMSADGPTLYVAITATRAPDGVVGGYVEVMAYKIVPVDLGSAHLVLWRDGYSFIVRRRSATGQLRELVADLVKEFDEDFKAAQAYAKREN